LDDKHCVEPGAPVAAAERGKQVFVSTSQSFQVCDHNFTQFSLIPIVLLRVDTPDSVNSSWYDGQVLVGIKEAVFEPFSALRTASKLHAVFMTEASMKPILFLYTDFWKLELWEPIVRH